MKNDVLNHIEYFVGHRGHRISYLLVLVVLGVVEEEWVWRR